MNTLVWDTTGPLHASRCDRLAVLVDAAGPGKHLVPEAVAAELSRLGHPLDPTLFDVASLDTIEAIRALATWQERLGSDRASGAHVGEAEVAAVAETQQVTAIIDDSDARRVVRRHGLDAHGVLWAISRGVIEGRAASANAFSGLCDQMLTTGVRWPFETGGYPGWFEQHRGELE